MLFINYAHNYKSYNGKCRFDRCLDQSIENRLD